jgi:hypothetical protein
MRVDLKFRYSDDVFLRLSQSYNVVGIVKDKNFILVQVSDIQKHFLDTKQLTKQYLKKHI